MVRLEPMECLNNTLVQIPAIGCKTKQQRSADPTILLILYITVQAVTAAIKVPQWYVVQGSPDATVGMQT